MPLILFSLSNDGSWSGPNTISLRMFLGIASNNDLFLYASAIANGEPPFGVPSSLVILAMPQI